MPDATAAQPQAQRQSQTTLSRLRRASRTLFVRDGYHNTRPQDIVREAGVANGTFYIHFKDKRDAFLDFAEQAQNELLDQYLVGLEGITGQQKRWRVIFDTLIDYSIQHPGVLHAAFFDPVFIAPDDPEAWRLYDRMGHLVHLAVGDEAAAARLAEQYDLELIGHALCGLLRHAFIYGARKQMDRDTLTGELSAFIDRALPLDATNAMPEN